MRRRRLCRPAAATTVLALIAALAAIAASPVSAATFGSDLSGAVEASGGCVIVTAPCTSLVGSVPATNADPATSPIDGVVVAFGIKVGAPAASVTFRLAQSSGIEFAGAGTGPTVSLPAAGTYSIPARVRVKTNDYAAVDGSEVAAFESTCFLGANALLFSPPLAEGAPEPFGASGICGLEVNATVEPDADGDGFGDETQDRCPGLAGPESGCPLASPPPRVPVPPPAAPPSNVFSFGRLKRDAKAGTATLVAIVPGPGSLSLSGRKVKPVNLAVSAAGRFSLRIAPKGGARKILERSGSLRVGIVLGFTPNGGAAAQQRRSSTLRFAQPSG